MSLQLGVLGKLVVPNLLSNHQASQVDVDMQYRNACVLLWNQGKKHLKWWAQDLNKLTRDPKIVGSFGGQCQDVDLIHHIIRLQAPWQKRASKLRISRIWEPVRKAGSMWSSSTDRARPMDLHGCLQFLLPAFNMPRMQATLSQIIKSINQLANVTHGSCRSEARDSLSWAWSE